MFRKRLSAGILGSLFLGVALILGARTPEPEPSGPQETARPRAIRTEAVTTSAPHREVRISGVTRSARRASLAFTVPARVVARPVRPGDTVRVGDLLARLDDREYVLAERTAAAAVAEVDARLARARRDEARVARLVELRAATVEELEHLQAATAALRGAHDAASARLDEARRLLREISLTAPFEGTVTAVSVEPGEWAGAGVKVIELSGRGAIEVEVDVPESVRLRLTAGSPVRIDLPTAGRSLTGRITQVADAAAGPGRLFPALVRIDEAEGLIAGLAAEVVLSVTEAPALTVPLSAVIDSGSSRPAVFRIEGTKAHRITVQPGRLIGDRLTITSADLAEGDRIAVAGHTALVDGDVVEVR